MNMHNSISLLSKCLFIGRLLGLAALCMGLSFFAIKQTDGFTLWGISASRPYDPRWQTRALTQEESFHVEKALKQPYVYFSKGAQTFVFLSQDGEYIIKFFNQHLFTPSKWLNLLPLPSWLQRYRYKRNWKRQDKYERDFASYKLAFEELKEQTAVFYVHLNPSQELKKSITIKDKLGIAHQVDLDRMDFILQKKAEQVHEHISFLMNKHEEEKAKEAINQVFLLILTRCKKGYKDRDPSIETNCGFINGGAIKIDVGRLERCEAMAHPSVYIKELESITLPFKRWIAYYYPQLIPAFDTQMELLKNNEAKE